MKNIFAFSLLCFSISSSFIKAQDSHAVLKRELDGSYYTSKSQQLYFTVDGEYNTMNLDYKVYNTQRAVVPGITVTGASLNNGDNRYLMTLPVLPSGYYVLEVTNQKKEKRVLRFFI
jgi:hypothetical protein